MSSANFSPNWVYSLCTPWLEAYDASVSARHARRVSRREAEIDRLMGSTWFWLFPYVPKVKRTREYVENHLGPLEAPNDFEWIIYSVSEGRKDKVVKIRNLCDEVMADNPDSLVTLTDEDINLLLNLPKSGG